MNKNLSLVLGKFWNKELSSSQTLWAGLQLILTTLILLGVERRLIPTRGKGEWSSKRPRGFLSSHGISVRTCAPIREAHALLQCPPPYHITQRGLCIKRGSILYSDHYFPVVTGRQKIYKLLHRVVNSIFIMFMRFDLWIIPWPTKQILVYY